MILRQHRSLGMLPELITFVFLAAAVATLGLVATRVVWRRPVVLVPNAIGAGALAPARADDEYCRAFVAGFLADWATWNEHTYRYRASRAIALMTPAVRAEFTAHADRAASLVESLSQSQALTIDALAVTALDPARGLHGARVDGSVKCFYGGVGGSAEPFHAQLLLRDIAPTAERPVCLEVLGFVVDRPHDPEATP